MSKMRINQEFSFSSPRTHCCILRTQRGSSAKEHTERQLHVIAQQNDLPPVLAALSTEVGRWHSLHKDDVENLGTSRGMWLNDHEENRDTAEI